MLKKTPKKHRGAIDRQAENAQKEGLKSLAIMLLAGLFVLGFAGFLYLSPLLHYSPPKPKKSEMVLPKVDYEFYERLPKQKFYAIPKGMGDVPQQVSVPESVADDKYFLQIKSYYNADEADNKRSEVLMAGVDAVVERHQTQEGELVFVVVSAPMDEQNAKTAHRRLQNSGIDALLLRQNPS